MLVYHKLCSEIWLSNYALYKVWFFACGQEIHLRFKYKVGSLGPPLDIKKLETLRSFFYVVEKK